MGQHELGSHRSPDLFGHPRGLAFLILTGLWENAALFGLRIGLVYYLVNQLGLRVDEAFDVYGLYSASTVLGVVGGFVADKYMGLRRGVIVGILMMSSGLALILIGPLLYVALVLVAAGSGLTRPTLMAQVGQLYAVNDPRRDRAYTAYYVGINLGAVISPFIFGTIGETRGWDWAFAASSVGMLVSVGIFLRGWRFIPDERPCSRDSVAERDPGSVRMTLLLLGTVWIAGVCFWMAYGQIGSTLALWAEKGLNRGIRLGGKELLIPASWFQSVNPLFIFAFAPWVNWRWARGSRPATTGRALNKMTAGAVMLALCFALLTVAASVSPGKPGWVWLFLALAPFSLGELYWTPVVIDLFNRLAIKGYVAVFTSLVSFALMVGFAFSGWLGHLFGIVATGTFFAVTAAAALLAAILIRIARLFDRQESGVADGRR